MKLREQKAITLIALIITIIVLIILAAVSIIALVGDDGIIARAQQARDETNRKVAQEAVTMGWTECQTNYMVDGNGVDKQTYFVNNIKQNIDKQTSSGEYLETSTIDVTATSTINYAYKGKIYVFYVNENGNVTYAGDKDQGQKDEIPGIDPPSTEYKLVGEIYCNSPDLSGFAKDATYYVTYDDAGNETIAGRIDRVNPPENWYDYSSGSKKWANIVTITGDQVAYWVWIPKYVYSLDQDNEVVNAYFVSQNTTAEATEYKYKTKDGEFTISASEYFMPESFTFAGKNLAGFWTSKYEISESTAINTEILQCAEDANKIIISTNNPSGDYKIFVDGVEKYNGELPYTLSDLVENASYDICLISETNGPIGRKKIWTKEIIQVDISGFNKESTFYVTYNADGSEKYTRLDKGMPVDWYNYAEKRWANIVTINENQVAYWTYIPRYEYIANQGAESADVKFIPKTQTEPDEGYSIPESFTFNGQALAGFWTSKYEISESTAINTEILQCAEHKNSIDVTTNNPSGEYLIYKDGNLIYTGTLPYTIADLNENSTHDITLISKTSGPIGRRKVTARADLGIEIDLTGFNTNTTFYVLYSSDGQTVESEDIPISTELSNEQKAKWYDYSQKRWANIKTVSEDGSLVAYWTYIPRYEYIANQGAETADIKFIPKKQTEPDPGWLIPESFTFAEKDLAGFWVSKYEISE